MTNRSRSGRFGGFPLAGGVPLLLSVALACGGMDDDEAGMAEPPRAEPGDPSASGGFGGMSGPGSESGGTAPLPPEEEITFEAPVVTGKYLWSANPESGRVALVDAETYRVQTLRVGNAPTHVAPVPSADGASADTAIVLNVASQDATLFRATPGGVTHETYLTHAGANAWAVSPSGRWAIAWTDAKLIDGADPAEGFQDLTLLLLRPGAGDEDVPASVRHGTIGFRPSSVSFDTAETRAFIVTDDGISVLDLTRPTEPAALVVVGEDPLEDSSSREVNVLPDGTLALVRRDGDANIGVVDLGTGAISSLALPGAVSDLDVSLDGGRAVAVMRELRKVAVLALPGALALPSAVEIVDVPALAGSASLSPDASVVVLYTTATPSDVVVTLDLRPEHYLDQRVADLRAPVRGVMVAPDGGHAVAVLEPAAGSVKQGAFAILDTARQLSAKVIGAEAPIESVAIAPGPVSDTALVTVHGESLFGVYAVRLPTMQVDYVGLASPPLSAGLIAEVSKGFVAQEHPEGRLTFVEFPPAAAVDDGSSPPLTVHTLTGFELAAKVVLPGEGF